MCRATSVQRPYHSCETLVSLGCDDCATIVKQQCHRSETTYRSRADETIFALGKCSAEVGEPMVWGNRADLIYMLLVDLQT